jgi:hypothetical protein
VPARTFAIATSLSAVCLELPSPAVGAGRGLQPGRMRAAQRQRVIRWSAAISRRSCGFE